MERDGTNGVPNIVPNKKDSSMAKWNKNKTQAVVGTKQGTQGVVVPLQQGNKPGPHVAPKGRTVGGKPAAKDWRNEVPDDSPAAIIGRDGGSIGGFFREHVEPTLPDDMPENAKEYALAILKLCGKACREAFANPVATKADGTKTVRTGLCFSLPNGDDYDLVTFKAAKAGLRLSYPNADADKAVMAKLNTAASETAETAAVERLLVDGGFIVKGGVYTRGPAYALAGCPVKSVKPITKAEIDAID